MKRRQKREERNIRLVNDTKYKYYIITVDRVSNNHVNIKYLCYIIFNNMLSNNNIVGWWLHM